MKSDLPVPEGRAPDRVVFAFALVLLAAPALSVACTPGQRSVARTALDVAQTLCIVTNQGLAESEVARLCGIAGPLFDPMRQILSASRSASAQAAVGARAATCGEGAR